MLTLTIILVIAALLCTIAAAMGKAPLYVSVLLLCIVEVTRILPIS